MEIARGAAEPSPSFREDLGFRIFGKYGTTDPFPAGSFRSRDFFDISKIDTQAAQDILEFRRRCQDCMEGESIPTECEQMKLKWSTNQFFPECKILNNIIILTIRKIC